MENQEFNPKTFFYLHGKYCTEWNENEITETFEFLNQISMEMEYGIQQK